VRATLDVHFLSNVDEALKLALEGPDGQEEPTRAELPAEAAAALMQGVEN
jgi:hypothetical protein